MPVLDPSRGRTKTGQLWAYAAEDRPWGGADPPRVVCVYAPDRKFKRPIAHLDGFKGTLQVDGYAGYRKLAERGDVQLAFCSQMRRNFYELAIPGRAPIASEALEGIAEFTLSRRTFVAAAPRSGVSSGNTKTNRSPMHSSSGYVQNSV